MGTVSGALSADSVVPGSGLSLTDGLKIVTWTFSNSYTTGGETLTVPGFSTIDAVFIVPTAQPGAATGKIQAFVSTTGAEVAATTNLSTYTLSLLVFGR